MGNGNVQELAINTLPFWSRFTLSADLRFDGTNTLRTIFQAGFTIPVFDYRKGEQNVAALEGSRSTARDTLLTQANQTRGGGQYTIHGISFTKDGWPYLRSGDGAQNGLIHALWPPNSMQPANGAQGPLVLSVEDFRALDSLMNEVFLKYFRIELQVDGTARIIEMGPSMLYPGVGGPFGGNVDTLNGGAVTFNYMKIKEGISWNPAGAVDSNMIVSLQAAYNCVLPTWTAPDGLAPDGTPIVGANKTAMGRVWTQGWIVNFHGYQTQPTSNVS